MSLERLLITGASSDIAKALIRRLSRWESCPSIIAHFNSNQNRILQLQEIYGEKLQGFSADLTCPEGVDYLVKAIKDQWDYPDGIVHFAALPLRLERFKTWNQEHFLKDIILQVSSLGAILQAFLPAMSRSDKPCKVVFILSSVVHGLPPKFMSMYTVVKYAQMGLMRATAAEYAGTNVFINAVSPAMVETQFLSALSGKAIELSAAAMPHGRNIQPEDVVGSIQFLLSQDSDSCHGIVIPVTDGSIV